MFAEANTSKNGCTLIIILWNCKQWHNFIDKLLFRSRKR